MRHPTDGTLRRLLDEPAGVADTDREHIAACPVCQCELAAAQQDAAFADAALGGVPTIDVDAEMAWSRLSDAIAVDEPRRATTVAPVRRWRTALRRPAVAGLGVAVLVAGAGVAAAMDWLPIFRTEQITPVTAPEADLVTLPDLSDFGELEVSEEVDIRPVSGVDAAEEATGLAVPMVSELPRGVTGDPTYHVGEEANALFTFSAEKTEQTAAAAGETLPPAPPELDGSRFRLTAGPGVAAVWSEGRPVPALIVARAVAPTAYSSGVPFETARDYLLSLPIVPENVASQLRGFSGDGTTLPLFMAAEELTSSATEVDGMPATVFTSRDGALAGVVWVDDGVVTAVAGSVSADEVLSVAHGLRWDR
ncbi:DUF4367 domain-containing protein [Phytoactinopolyspora halotolerans]|uniref:DUF4367 domain-containing protein n=1 Tax=Phytoactinopolyspora halotolerans TaxID=1981512 RepID=A0A6L9SG99_9ACTN|nr:DUF4367 domain-containing protein [Phytoactinopolyspora halotolerans]NEE04385.1 hypothetical protein [Phytoactinopolyspora halotolerans]